MPWEEEVERVGGTLGRIFGRLRMGGVGAERCRVGQGGGNGGRGKRRRDERGELESKDWAIEKLKLDEAFGGAR